MQSGIEPTGRGSTYIQFLDYFFLGSVAVPFEGIAELDLGLIQQDFLLGLTGVAVPAFLLKVSVAVADPFPPVAAVFKFLD